MDNPSFVKILVDCDESEIVKQFANGEYVVIPSRNILLITSEQFDKTCEALRPEIQTIRDS